jgi:hypothetical protein
MATATFSLSHFDAELLRDPYCCFSAEDLVEPPEVRPEIWTRKRRGL